MSEEKSVEFILAELKRKNAENPDYVLTQQEARDYIGAMFGMLGSVIAHVLFVEPSPPNGYTWAYRFDGEGSKYDFDIAIRKKGREWPNAEGAALFEKIKEEFAKRGEED